MTPQEVTLAKGLIAGAVNLGIGILTAGSLPRPGVGLASLAVGAVCYGGSIVLFITAAQRLGAARGQVIFASGPFFGMLFSFLLLSESPSWLQGAAAAILLGSIALMLRARHLHTHAHERVVHIHAHSHDDLHHTHVHPCITATSTGRRAGDLRRPEARSTICEYRCPVAFRRKGVTFIAGSVERDGMGALFRKCFFQQPRLVGVTSCLRRTLCRPSQKSIR
jgi:hypothetical protein